MAEDDRGRAPVVLGPGVAHRQAIVVGLAGGVPVERERPDRPRGAAGHVGAHAGVGDDEAALVEDEMGHEAIDEFRHPLGELGRLGLELGESFSQTVAGGHLGPLEGPGELDLVVAGHHEGMAGGDHTHGEAQDGRGGRTAVDQIADEKRPAAMAVDGVGAVRADQVAEPVEKFGQLVVAAVDVADDVERPAVIPPVGPQRDPLDDGAVDLVDTVEDPIAIETLAAEVAEAAAQLGLLVAQHVGAEVPLGPGGVALRADRFGDVEDDGDGENVVALGQGDQALAGLRLDVGGVDDHEPAGCETFAGDEVQDLEGGLGGRLVILVVGDQAPAEVAGEHLGPEEVASGEARFARAGDADQDDQAQLRDVDTGHQRSSARQNTASWVGWPASGSSGPTPVISTP